MPHLFTVRWPVFARLEAAAMFSVALPLASQIGLVRIIVEKTLVPGLLPLALQLGVPRPAVVWVSVALVALFPYLALLAVADRLLTLRKGYALLSVIAIAIWTGASIYFSGTLSELIPARIVDATQVLPASQRVPLLAAILALLPHLRPLWIGLRDDGDVAMRLISEREESTQQRRRANDALLQDVYHRQTAGFREWQPREQYEGLFGSPRKRPYVKILYALTAIGVIVVMGGAYHNWDNLKQSLTTRETVPVVQAALPSARYGAVTIGTTAAVVNTGGTTTAVEKTGGVNINGANTSGPNTSATTAVGAAAGGPMPLNPVPPSPPPRPSAANVALPSIQHPGQLLPTVQTPSALPPLNEAVAERGRDGGFAFDTVVNGTHVPMIFDTGASMVAIRGEDAARVGIDVAQLNYSAKVKTANGIADVAPVIIETLSIGNITQRNVTGFVARRGALHENLLGQSFLSRLTGFNVEKNLLVLRGR